MGLMSQGVLSLAALGFESSFPVLGLVAIFVLLGLFVLVYVPTRYKRCPSNRVLVVYGKVGGQQAAKCMHGGGAFIIPLIQGLRLPLTRTADHRNRADQRAVEEKYPRECPVDLHDRYLDGRRHHEQCRRASARSG